MPYNGSGGFDPLSPPDFPAVAGAVIKSAEFNNVIQDILTGLGLVITRDGQSTWTGNQNAGGHGITGLSAGSAASDAVRFDQAAVLRGALGAVDWNTITNTGYYDITTASVTTPAVNFPPAVTGNLSVINNGLGNILQFVIGGSSITFRFKTGGTWGAWVTTTTTVTVVADIATLRTVTPSAAGQAYFLLGMTTLGLGYANWYYDATDTTSLDDGQFVVRNGAYRFKRFDARTRFGTFSIMFDTSDTTVRDTLLPMVTAAGFRAAIALPLSQLYADYNRMTLGEIDEYCRLNTGEVLAHGSNGVVLNSSVATTTGESWIRATKHELTQYGFKANGYVAINSTLDPKFLPEIKRWYDYGCINSSDGTFPSLSANDASTNFYDMYRVSIESSTPTKLQACIDYAKNTFTNVIFYTHNTSTNLATLLSALTASGLKCELPSEFVARTKGLSKTMDAKPTENLINNSIFAKQKTTDIAPIGWTISSATMTGISTSITAGEGGNQIDINATAPGVDNRLLFSQNYQSGPILAYTPFCFAVNATGLFVTNTIVRITLAAKDVTNATLASTVRDFTLSSDTQLLYASQGFVPGGTAVSYIQVLIELRSIAAGAVRAIFEKPRLTRSGVPLPFIKTNLTVPSFWKMRNNTASSIATATDTVIIYNVALQGSNDFYDTSTGNWISNDGGKYMVTVTQGLNSMAAGDKLTIKLFVDTGGGAVQREVADFTCTASNFVGNCSFMIPADGATYSIRIWHNNAGSRTLTTGHNSTLSFVRVSN